jgi:hypothetical protein
MGTTKINNNTKEVNCKICRQAYTLECDYDQGRCPHHLPMLQLNSVSRDKLTAIICVSFVRVLAGIVLITQVPDFLIATGILLIVAELFDITKKAVK